jgi:asparagine synthase (glutamine-hydrolysing)
VPELLRLAAGPLLPAASKTGARLRNSDFDMLISTGGSFALCAALLADPAARVAFLDRLANAFPEVCERAHLPLLYRQMTFDLAVYLPEEILFLFDQMSMAHTVEGRVPLLDIDVVEAAYRFPPSAHVRGDRTKILFRELAEPQLGHAHVWREKHGFTGPVTAWVACHRQRFVDAAASLREIPGLESIGAAATRADCSSDELFILYCLRRWHDGLVAA